MKSVLHDTSFTPLLAAVRPHIFPSRPTLDTLWHEGTPEAWREAKGVYWQLVKPHLLATEIALNDLDPAYVRELSATGWYNFLLTQYFPWKYTAPNRLATTTAQLRTYSSSEIELLFEIKEELFAFDRDGVRRGLILAKSVRGLGVAGASGLLALLFPADFGTVDQFAVKALRSVSGLSGQDRLARMKPEGLTVSDGVLLVELMREKAAELNQRFATTYWTPRKLDMVLWTYGR